MSNGESNASEIWQAVIGFIRAKSEDAYRQWFKKMIPISVDDEQIVIGTSDRFFASWVMNNYRDVLADALAAAGCPGLKGHSDADVLLHAVIDALLGAAALGDIGSHFPDTDPAWEGADSAKLLGQVVHEVSDAGYRVGNVDATVICERPRLRPHVESIRARIAAILGTGIAQVSVKGKTNEKMDDVGAGAGIVAHCVVLLEETR